MHSIPLVDQKLGGGDGSGSVAAAAGGANQQIDVENLERGGSGGGGGAEGPLGSWVGGEIDAAIRASAV